MSPGTTGAILNALDEMSKKMSSLSDRIDRSDKHTSHQPSHNDGIPIPTDFGSRLFMMIPDPSRSKNLDVMFMRQMLQQQQQLRHHKQLQQQKQQEKENEQEKINPSKLWRRAEADAADWEDFKKRAARKEPLTEQKQKRQRQE